MSGVPQTDGVVPHFVVIALKESGAEEFLFDGGPGMAPVESHWRWPATPSAPVGTDPIHWRTAILHMGARLRRADARVAELVEEVARLKAAKPKPGVMTTEFWLSVLGAAPVVFITVAGQLEEFAQDIPHPWGPLLKMGAGAAVAFLTIRYGVVRGQAKRLTPPVGDSQDVAPRGRP